jgi:hypothetical protein
MMLSHKGVKSMIVTIVCDVLGEENNGTTIAAMNLIRSLKQKGHEVRVLCPDQNRKGHPGFFVVPKMSLGPLDAYVAKNGVTLARPDRKIIKSALLGADVVHLMTPFSLCVAAGKWRNGWGCRYPPVSTVKRKILLLTYS